jgi:predicted MFS family arabinose efflux permease
MLGVAALLWLLAAASFAAIAEPPQQAAHKQGAQDSFASQLRFAFQQPQFNRYLLSRTALLGTALMPPYLVSLASLGEPGSLRLLGGLLLVSSLAGMLSGFVWGRLADRSSARCMRYAGVMAGCAGLIALFATQQDGGRTVLVSVSVFLLYLAHAGVRVGRRTHMIDMTTQDDRSVLVAVSNTLIGIELLAVATIAALLNAWLNYGGVMLCTALALLGAALTTGLKEVQQEESG